MLDVADAAELRLVDGGAHSQLDVNGQPTRAMLVLDCSSAGELSAAVIDRAAANLTRSRALVVAVSPRRPPPDPLLEAADLTLVPGNERDRRVVSVPDLAAALSELAACVQANPAASLTLTWLLRAQQDSSVMPGLAGESAAYSMLLAGPEFGRWLAARPPARPKDAGDRVRTRRTGDLLQVTLTRSGRRNALDAAMRDGLREALTLAVWDESLRVEIDAEGPTFCAGGDLDEFGSARDPASAHVLRTVAGVGDVIDRVAARTTVYLHGSCVGSGVEIPAFAGTVYADGATTFRLPEVSMGLIPGAGGTISICARIGRWRTLWLAVTGSTVDTATALDWGLIDGLAPHAP